MATTEKHQAVAFDPPHAERQSCKAMPKRRSWMLVPIVAVVVVVSPAIANQRSYPDRRIAFSPNIKSFDAFNGHSLFAAEAVGRMTVGSHRPWPAMRNAAEQGPNRPSTSIFDHGCGPPVVLMLVEAGIFVACSLGFLLAVYRFTAFLYLGG
jgi:hypothetical protein